MLLPPTHWLLLTFLMQSLYPGTLVGSISTGCPPQARMHTGHLCTNDVLPQEYTRPVDNR